MLQLQGLYNNISVFILGYSFVTFSDVVALQTSLATCVAPNRIDPSDLRVRAPKRRPILDTYALVCPSAITGVVDAASGAVGRDANRGGTRHEGVALALAIINWYILEVVTNRAVVLYIEPDGVSRGGGGNEH